MEAGFDRWTTMAPRSDESEITYGGPDGSPYEENGHDEGKERNEGANGEVECDDKSKAMPVEQDTEDVPFPIPQESESTVILVPVGETLLSSPPQGSTTNTDSPPPVELPINQTHTLPSNGTFWSNGTTPPTYINLPKVINASQTYRLDLNGSFWEHPLHPALEITTVTITLPMNTLTSNPMPQNTRFSTITLETTPTAVPNAGMKQIDDPGFGAPSGPPTHVPSPVAKADCPNGHCRSPLNPATYAAAGVGVGAAVALMAAGLIYWFHRKNGPSRTLSTSFTPQMPDLETGVRGNVYELPAMNEDHVARSQDEERQQQMKNEGMMSPTQIATDITRWPTDKPAQRTQSIQRKQLPQNFKRETPDLGSADDRETIGPWESASMVGRSVPPSPPYSRYPSNLRFEARTPVIAEESGSHLSRQQTPVSPISAMTPSRGSSTKKNPFQSRPSTPRAGGNPFGDPSQASSQTSQQSKTSKGYVEYSDPYIERMAQSPARNDGVPRLPPIPLDDRNFSRGASLLSGGGNGLGRHISRASDWDMETDEDRKRMRDAERRAKIESKATDDGDADRLTRISLPGTVWETPGRMRER